MQRLTRDVLSFVAGVAITAGIGVRVVGIDFVQDKVKKALAESNATQTAPTDVPATREAPTPTTAPPESTATPAETTCHYERKNDPLPEDPDVSGTLVSRTLSKDGKTMAYVVQNDGWVDTQTLYFGSRGDCGDVNIDRSLSSESIEIQAFEQNTILVELNGKKLCEMEVGGMFCDSTREAPVHVLHTR